MLNFIDDPMARLIYETNSNMIFEPKLPTPEVEVEYGQTLAEATLKGIENAPAGAWVFKDADHVVTDQEVTDQTKFELIFQPADNKKYKSVTMSVPVKTVKKSEVVSANATDEMEIQEIEQLQSEAIDESSSAQKIVVNAEKKAKTYGEVLTSEDLTFTISDSEKEKLLPGDTVDSLGLTLKATTIVQEDILSGSTTDEDGDDILGAYGNAGKYVILKDNASNSNYDVEVRPAFLDVSPKEADVEWNAAAQYIYTGNACGIEANVKADSLLENDSCEIKRLLNAERTEVGSYKALAIGLTNANYIFSGMRRVCVWEYEILPADPEVTFPTVEVTYGDSLRKAVRTGQSGNGVFRFADNTAMLTVAENQSEQEMIFTPFNPNYKTVTSSVPVTVLPRKLTISPERTEKEYGQKITEFAWEISSGNLAGEDSLDDLNVKLSLTAGDAEKETCEVGTYEIVEKTPITVENANYEVAFEPGLLIVQPKPVEVIWNTDGKVNYTGKEANVSAELSGVLFNDDCKVAVEGGNAVEVGNYTAIITELTGEQRYNYVLHGEDTDYQIEYQIVKKEETKKPTDSKDHRQVLPERNQPIRRNHRQVLLERNQQELQCQENR